MSKNNIQVCYCGPARDYSGYGEANRHDIAALDSVGIELTAHVPKYVLELSDFGHLGELIDRVEDNKIDYNIKIIHSTPNVWGKFLEPGKYHIGRLIWETDKLPHDFILGARLMDEIWTGCEYSKQAILNSGVDRPVYVIPEAIDLEHIPTQLPPYEMPYKHDFMFYSIFEWSDRKNPEALLRAYWKTFKEGEDVGLVIKTYMDNFGTRNQNEILTQIDKIKRSLRLPYYAPLYVVDYLMDRHQIYRFHATNDCFVSAHRGEGWGVPQMEAMALGKPIISTNLGGIHEWIKTGIHGYTLDYDMIPIGKVSKNKQWYTQDMQWAEINPEGLEIALRFAFENRDENKVVAKNARKLLDTHFSLKAVGTTMKKRLEKISKKL